MANTGLSQEFESIIWTSYCTRSRATTKTQNNLHLFLEKLTSYSNKDVLAITNQDAIQFAEAQYKLIEKGKCKPSYVKVILISLRKFYDFLEQYKYDFRDRGLQVPLVNPFYAVTITIPDKVQLTAEDVPSLSQLDKLLVASKESNVSLFIAISLAAKMGLSINEISNLRKNTIGYMHEESQFEPIAGEKKQNLYICLNAVGDNGKTKRYLKVPADIQEILESENFFTEENTLPYAITYKGKHYSERTMQYQLKKLCENLDIDQITFADLRNLAIFLMKEGGATDKIIAKYTGQEGRWLTRFTGIKASQIFDSADYSRIWIKSEEELIE